MNNIMNNTTNLHQSYSSAARPGSKTPSPLPGRDSNPSQSPGYYAAVQDIAATLTGLKSEIDGTTFQSVAGDDRLLDSTEIKKLLDDLRSAPSNGVASGFPQSVEELKALENNLLNGEGDTDKSGTIDATEFKQAIEQVKTNVKP